MEYVIIDRDGASLDYFEHRRDAIEALRNEEQRKAGSASELALLTYAADGKLVGEPEPAEQLLENIGTTITIFGTPAGFMSEGMLAKPVALVEWSGKVASTHPGFHHQSEAAIDTPVPAQEETALR